MSKPLLHVTMSKQPIADLRSRHTVNVLSNLEEKAVLKRNSTLIFGTVALIFLLQVKPGYSLTPVPVPAPVIPPGFVEVTGPHGITVLVGPLIVSPFGGYEREVIVPGRPPFMVSTEPGVTPQDVAKAYG